MDLDAFSRVDELSEVAKKNGIGVNRLRGYRLMSEEKIVEVNEELIKHIHESAAVSLMDYMNEDFWSDNSDRVKKYLGSDGYIDWTRVKGKRKKYLKFYIKKQLKALDRQNKMFNSFVGRDDVLYIHTRLGGSNWNYYDCNTEVAKQPWYISHCDDWFDGTYCDIYAKIDPTTVTKSIE